MSSYKLIAFDMDGTFLNSKKQIEEGTIQAVRDATAAGKAVVINTGRSGPELLPFFEQIPDVHYAIGSNGAVLFDAWNHTVLSQTCIPADVVDRILTVGRRGDIMIHFLCAERSIVQEDQLFNMAHYSMGGYQPMFERICERHKDIVEYFRSAPFDIPKVNLYHTGPEARAISKAFAESIPAEMGFAETASLEFTAPGVTKGTGMMQLGRLLGIKPEEMIAVGDSDNDLTMLETAGLSVAMGNSFPAVLKIADVKVADCDHGGCAETIYKYLL